MDSPVEVNVFDSIEKLLSDVVADRTQAPVLARVDVDPEYLVTAEQIDQWLTRGQITSASIAFSRENTPADLSMFSSGFVIQGQTWPFLVSGDRARALVRDGYSMILSGPEAWDEHLRSLALTTVLRTRVSLNTMIFITPPGTSGFFHHRDPDDYVVVVQTEGTKSWRLYDAAPDGWTERDLSRPSLDALSRELTLEPGGVLVIPRGWGHAASAGETLSVHLSFGLNLVSPAHFFRLALVNALKEMRESATMDETFAVYEELVDEFHHSDSNGMLEDFVAAPFREGSLSLTDLRGTPGGRTWFAGPEGASSRSEL